MSYDADRTSGSGDALHGPRPDHGAAQLAWSRSAARHGFESV